VWVQSLEKKAEDLSSLNGQLQVWAQAVCFYLLVSNIGVAWFVGLVWFGLVWFFVCSFARQGFSV
jgi:hypothetical protein